MKKIRPHIERADRVVVHNVMTMPLNLALTEVLTTLAREKPDRFIAWTHDISYFDERYAKLTRRSAPWDLVTKAIPGVRYVTVSEQRSEQLSRLTGLRAATSLLSQRHRLRDVLGLHPRSRSRNVWSLRAYPLLLLPVRLTGESASTPRSTRGGTPPARNRARARGVDRGTGRRDDQAYLGAAKRAKKVRASPTRGGACVSVRHYRGPVCRRRARLFGETEGCGIPMLAAVSTACRASAATCSCCDENGGEIRSSSRPTRARISRRRIAASTLP